MMCLYIFINQALLHQLILENKLVTKICQQMRSEKKANSEYQQMFHSLEAGIAVVQNQQINFCNSIYQELLQVINPDIEPMETVDAHIFRVYRKDDEMDMPDRPEPSLCASSSIS